MKRQVKKLENSKVEVICDFDETEWKESQDKAFKKLAKNLELPGFRKGKVPEAMARKNIDIGRIFNEAINDSLQPTYDLILNEDKVQPFARPSVDVTKVTEKELQIKFTIITAPEVKLGKYKGLGIKKAEVKVTDADIDAEIQKLVAQNANLVVSEKPAKKGDTVVIDFVGSVDGKEFEGGKADNYSLELGSNSFVPGFEDQLIGAKANDKIDVNVTFPEQYVPELAGKKALFKVTVHEVKEKIVPALDDELIKDLNIPNVTNVQQLKEYEKQTLTSQRDNKAKSDALNEAIEKIAADATIELADEIINEEVEGMKKNMEQQISQRGLTMDQYLQITGQKQEDVDKKMKEDAIKNLRAILVMEEIARQENITVDEKDADFEMAKIADQYKMEIDKVKEILGKDMPKFMSELRQRRIQDFIAINNID